MNTLEEIKKEIEKLKQDENYIEIISLINRSLEDSQNSWDKTSRNKLLHHKQKAILKEIKKINNLKNPIRRKLEVQELASVTEFSEESITELQEIYSIDGQDVLGCIGKVTTILTTFGIFLGTVFYLIDMGKRRTENNNSAWGIVRDAKNEVASNGRIDALNSLSKGCTYSNNYFGSSVVNWFFQNFDIHSGCNSLVGVNLKDANIPSVQLNKSELSNGKLDNAILERANLGNAKLISVSASGTNLRYANLQGVELQYSNLERANLSHANLRDANISNVNLYGANLRYVDLRGSNLDNTYIEIAYYNGLIYNLDTQPFRGLHKFFKKQIDEGFKIYLICDLVDKEEEICQKNRDFKNADLQGFDLSETDLTNKDLTGANFKDSILKNADLKESDLMYVNFRSATLTEAKIDCSSENSKIKHIIYDNKTIDFPKECADRKEVYKIDTIDKKFNFSNKKERKLPLTTLNKENLVGADFRGADLRDADLRCANLTGVNFSNADLRGANLAGAIFDKTTLKGAIYDISTKLQSTYLLCDKVVEYKKPKKKDMIDYLNKNGAFFIENKSTLKNFDKTDINLENASLSEAILEGAVLTRSNLRKARLRDANLKKAKLKKADLFQSDLSGAILDDADLESANLSGANLTDASLIRTNLRKVNFQSIQNQTNLSNAILMDADMQQSSLQGAILLSAQLQGTDLYKSNLENADLRWANLQEANLNRANLQGAKLEKADLSGADLSGTNLLNVDLSETRLDRVIVDDKTKYDAKYKEKFNQARRLQLKPNAKLKGKDLTGFDLKGRKLTGITLEDVDLRNADLSHADLTNATLTNVNLRNANLRNANLRNAKGLTVEQVIKAKNWELAKYDRDFCQQLQKQTPTTLRCQ
jgi:uncharacterized protein YjbI with pentapeptide repeats